MVSEVLNKYTIAIWIVNNNMLYIYSIYKKYINVHGLYYCVIICDEYLLGACCVCDCICAAYTRKGDCVKNVFL